MSVAAAPVVLSNLGSAAKRSLGDVNIEIQRVALISGDVSCVATAAGLSRIEEAIWCVSGAAVLTAVTTYSNNQCTFTFTDPVATVKGHIILLGR